MKQTKNNNKPFYHSKLLGGLIVLGIFLFSLSIFIKDEISTPTTSAFAGKEITVYKSPFCGCCEGHVEAYRSAGFKVNVVEGENKLNSIKREYEIPGQAQSCHTAIIDDYVVEGHVPLIAIEKLLEEQPQIDGISLPGMPSGTPGMPGPKMGDFEVVSLKGGEISENFITI